MVTRCCSSPVLRWVRGSSSAGRAHPWPWQGWGAGARSGSVGTEQSSVVALRCRRWSSLGLRGLCWRKWFGKEMRCEHSALALSVWPPTSSACGQTGLLPRVPGLARELRDEGCGGATALGSCPQPQLTTGTTERCCSWGCHGRAAATPLPRWECPPVCCWPKAAPQDTLQSPALGTAGSTGWH